MLLCYYVIMLLKEEFRVDISEEKKRTTIYINNKLLDEAKIFIIKNKDVNSFSELISLALKEYIYNHENR